MAKAPNFWYIRHPFSWYENHPNLISWNECYAKNNKDWRSIKIDDKVIYYSHEEPKGIVGIFEVTSKMYKHSFENGPLELCYDVKPLYLPISDGNRSVQPRKFSPKEDVELSLKPKGTIVKLKPDQYRKIKAFLLGMEEPVNHEGVVALFSKIHREVGFPFIKEIRQKYPDIVAEDMNGKEKKIELEFDSDDFRKDMENGKHDPKKCDCIVCWHDGWGQTRPKKLKLIELQALYGS